MGYYINPSDGNTKERWLALNGLPVKTDINTLGFKDVPKGYLPVCLVDNGPFTAAAIAFSDEEFQEFRDPKDYRPKIWFLVRKDKLLNVCPALSREVKPEDAVQ